MHAVTYGCGKLYMSTSRAVQPLSIDAKLLLEAEGLTQRDERRLGRSVQP